MIKNCTGKTTMVFGTGDIGFNGGAYMKNGSSVGIIIFYNQEAREIGSPADFKAGTPVNFEDFPVVMEFHKAESIDVVIESLLTAKKEMEDSNALFKD